MARVRETPPKGRDPINVSVNNVATLAMETPKGLSPLDRMTTSSSGHVETCVRCFE